MRTTIVFALLLALIASSAVALDTTRVIIQNNWVANATDDAMGPIGDNTLLTGSIYGEKNFGKYVYVKLYHLSANALNQGIYVIDSLWHSTYLGPGNTIINCSLYVHIYQLNYALYDRPAITLHRMLHPVLEGTRNNVIEVGASCGHFWAYATDQWCSRNGSWYNGCYAPGTNNDTLNTWNSTNGRISPYVDYDSTVYDSVDFERTPDLPQFPKAYFAWAVDAEYLIDCIDDSVSMYLLLQMARSDAGTSTRYVIARSNQSSPSTMPFLVVNYTELPTTPDTAGAIRGGYIRGGYFKGN